MKRYTKFIATGIVSTMLLAPLSSYAGSIDIFLDKLSTANPLIKSVGISQLEGAFNKGDDGIDSLKNTLDSFLPESYRKSLESKGYTMDDLKGELDEFKSWSKEDKDSLVRYLRNDDTSEVSKLIEKNKAKEEPKEEPKKEDNKQEQDEKKPDKDEDKKDQDKNNPKDENIIEDITSIKFKDVEGHWGKKEIEFLANKDIIKGKGEGIFDPNGKVTRAEFTSLITRVFDLKVKNTYDLKFKDVKKDIWYYDAVKAAVDNGVIQGIDANNFKPNDNISREQMAVIVMRALEGTGNVSKFSSTGKNISSFVDKKDISDWSKENLGKAVDYGLLNGKGNNNLAPKDTTTRAESASLLYRIYTNINK